MNAQAPAKTFELENGSTALKPKKAKGRDKFGHLSYDKDELAQAIEELFPTNDTFRTRFDSFWEALGHGSNDFHAVKTRTQSKEDMYGSPALMYTAVQNMRVVQADAITGTLFASRNGNIKLHKGEIQFVPDVVETGKNGKTVTKRMTYEDAFNAILLASTNKAMLQPNILSIEGGKREDRILYMRAIEAYNAAVTPDLRFTTKRGISAPAWDIPHFSPAKKFQNYMNRAVTPAGAPEEHKEIPEDILSQAGVNTADTPTAETEVKKDVPPAPADATASQTSPQQPAASDPFAQATKESAKPAPAAVPPEEQAAYITAKLEAIENYVTANEKAILKQPPVDKTGGTPERKVYLVQIDGYPNDKTYLAKIKGKLHVILSTDDNNIGLIQNDDVYLQNDMDHPKHPLHRFAQITREQKSFPIVGKDGAQIGPVEFSQNYKGYDEFQKSFSSAAAIERQTRAAIREAAKLDKNAPMPGTGSMG